MAEFHFSSTFLVPSTKDVIREGRFAMVPRKWEVSVFDLATLATRHRLHLPYQMIDVLLGRVNLEFSVDAESVDEARDWMRALQIGLYINGLSPFIVPIVGNVSLNVYAGINSRDSELTRHKLPEGMRDGPKSDELSVEIWPGRLAIHCLARPEGLAIGGEQFVSAVRLAADWRDATNNQRILQGFEQAVLASPTIQPTAQALLHLWTGIESLFPSIQTEVSFRVALLLAALTADGPRRRQKYREIKRAYDLRSKVAHGSRADIEDAEFWAHWDLVLNILRAIATRKAMPDEEALLASVLD